jgi:hypothetical protein
MRLLAPGLLFLTVAVWFMPGGTLAAQSRDELRRKYGEPVSETFGVRPGVRVTATFGANGRVFEFLITPEYPTSIKSRNTTLSLNSVKAIIDELVPLSARGKPLMAGILNMECLPENDCYGSSNSYEKVDIYYNASGERVHYAVVRLKE